MGIKNVRHETAQGQELPQGRKKQQPIYKTQTLKIYVNKSNILRKHLLALTTTKNVINNTDNNKALDVV